MGNTIEKHRVLKMKLRAFFELIRLPATLTSPSDSMAGLALALTLQPQHLSNLLILKIMGISALVYAAGMICNDIFDVKIDMEQRRNRPIVSGNVSILLAWSWAIGLQMLALMLALSISETCFDIAFSTIVLTYLYNGLFKDIKIIGPVFMGLCRSANFMIGASLVFQQTYMISTSPFYSPWVLAGQTGIYVFALTLLSKFETDQDTGRILSLKYAMIFMIICSFFPLINVLGRSDFNIIHLLGSTVAIYGLLPFFKVLQKEENTPTEVRGYVMLGIRNIILINLATALSLDQWIMAVILGCLYFLSRHAGKWFYGT